MDQVTAEKKRALQLFREKQWCAAAEALAKCRIKHGTDRQILTAQAICYLRLGEHNLAVTTFESLSPPIPALAALNWAALLVHRRKFDQALQVLGQVDTGAERKAQHDKSAGSLKAPEEFIVIDRVIVDLVITCLLFDDVIAVISSKRDLHSLRLQKRNLFLKLINGFLSPFQTFLFIRVVGSIARRAGVQVRRSVGALANTYRDQNWVYGLHREPDFLDGKIRLEDMEDFEHANKVYAEVFLAYLDYYVNSRQDMYDFLLASIKPSDAHALYSIVRQKKPAVVLEIGTFVGFSTCLMAQALKDNKKGALYCFDPNLKHLSVAQPLVHAGKMLRALNLADHVRIHEGFFSAPREADVSNVPVLGKSIGNMLPPIDLALIDGDHETIAVLQDFMLLSPHLSPDAAVVFHDVKTWSTVRQAILTLFKDTKLNHRLRYFEFTPSGVDGLGVVQFREARP